MWYLVEDLFDQSWFMKAVIGWGWLCILIMLTSLGEQIYQILQAAP